jgi:asparagine synthase (glutamine-hydrolysing)
MCGFAGFACLSGLPGTPGERGRVLEAMTSRIAHRGPDDDTRYDDGRLALGFRRLSIIDVEGGQQPLWNESRDVLAVVNGEIYNHQDLRRQLGGAHRFRTRSDSEVVVHLYEEYGPGLVDAVNGIFAIVLWDAANRRLLLARDRLGVKPLYFTVTGQTLLFGSELKALLAHPLCPRAVDWQQVRRGNAVHQPVTPSYVRGVHHLPAGHTVVLEPGKPLRTAQYWSLQDLLARPEANARCAPEHYIERYAEVFTDSVRRQLMSDVPLGIFLSGGIDSSLIAAAAARERAELHCFTIAEPTTAATGDLRQARRVADRLGFPLHAVELNGPGFLDALQFDLEYMEYLVWCTESPRFIFEWFYKHELYRFAKTVYPELKVILTGAGADEFAGGYSTSFGTPRGSWQQYLDEHVGPHWTHFSRLEDMLGAPGDAATARQKARRARSGYQHMMYMNASSLQYYNLWLEDRTSSAHAIEARVPFLDHRLVELLAAVPPAHFETLFWDKRIVREQLTRLLPDYPADFPKVPFIAVPCDGSVRSLERQIVERTIGPFREKYLASGRLGASAREFERLCSLVAGDSDEASAAARTLLRDMQVVIFGQLCADGWRDPPRIPARSPLREVEIEVAA